MRRKELRRGAPYLLVLVGFLGVLVAVWGDRGVTSVASTFPPDPAVDVRNAVEADRPFFDQTVRHDIELLFDDAEYQELLAEFAASGTKRWIRADVIIDGVQVSDVGIRLKGNSTLGELGGTVASATSQAADLNFTPEVLECLAALGVDAPGRATQSTDGGVGSGTVGATADVAAAQPETIPWLIRFDKFVPGQRFDGLQSVALRPANGVAPASSLNEALLLDLLGRSGQPTQNNVHTLVSVNGGPSVLRLVVDNPDAVYADEVFDGPGVLYKANAEGSFASQGDDASSYEDAFSQVNRLGQQGLAPLVAFVQWVNAASAEEFVEDLPRYLDVEGFARYLAFHQLFANDDDMSGPGQNYYLYFDLVRQQFHVISWDVNRAGQGDPFQVPLDAVPGGLPPEALFGLPDGFDQCVDVSDLPAVLTDGHVLVDRFLGAAPFVDRYLDAYRDLFESLLANGTAAQQLQLRAEQLTALYPTAAATEIVAEADDVRSLLETRQTALAASDQLTGG